MGNYVLHGRANYDAQASEVELNKDDPIKARLAVVCSVPVQDIDLGIVQVGFWDEQAVALSAAGIKKGDEIAADGRLAFAMKAASAGGPKTIPEHRLNDVSKIWYRKTSGVPWVNGNMEAESKWTEVVIPAKPDKSVPGGEGVKMVVDKGKIQKEKVFR